MADLPEEALEELTGLFPELDPETGEGYGPVVRRSLKKFEARALLAANQRAA